MIPSIPTISFDEYIWGDKFKTLTQPNVSFVKIDDVKNYLARTSCDVLVTHNGDLPVDSDCIRFESQFRIWFGQNVLIKHPKINPIPIGLENDYVPNSIVKKTMLYEMSLPSTIPEKLLYVNHNIGTNPSERIIPYQVLSKDDFTIAQCNGFSSQRDYYKDIINHACVLSPPGNGIDCHRTWEILYLKRVPVLKRVGCLESLYSKLPVIFFDDYREITKKFIEDNLANLESKLFDYQKLKFNYWKDRINNE